MRGDYSFLIFIYDVSLGLDYLWDTSIVICSLVPFVSSSLLCSIPYRVAWSLYSYPTISLRPMRHQRMLSLCLMYVQSHLHTPSLMRPDLSCVPRCKAKTTTRSL